MNLPRYVVDACWVMLPRLQAEEALAARGAAIYPFLETAEQRSRVRELEQQAGTAEPPRKPTRADLQGIGIQVV